MKRVGSLILLCGIGLIIRCALPLGEDFTLPGSLSVSGGDSPAESPSSNIITDYNLQNYVPMPVEGEMPVWNIGSRIDMEGTVEWEEKEGESYKPLEKTAVFIEGKVYRAAISLAAINGWTFHPDISFSYPKGEVEKQPDPNTDSLVRPLSDVTYKPTAAPAAITDINLSVYVRVPVWGFLPVFSFYGPQYTGTVEWMETSTSSLLDSSFLPETEYTATVTLSAASGYIFPAGIKFYHTGDSVAPEPPGNLDFNFTQGATRGTVVIRFPQTEAPFSVKTFAPGTDSDSALYQMIQEADMGVRKPLEITLPPGSETIQEPVELIREKNSPAEIIINGDGRILKTGDFPDEPLITIGADVTLILQDITLEGSAGRSAPLVRVESGGTFILDSGTILTGNENNTGYSAAGVVVSNGGRLEMKGTAEISGNTLSTTLPSTDHSGAAVYIDAGAEFIQVAGSIKSNNIHLYFDEDKNPYAQGGKLGSVYVAPEGSFTMKGGSIMKNQVKIISLSSNDQVVVFPSVPKISGTTGVFVDGGEFILQAGSITENTGDVLNGGVFVENGIFKMMGGEITKNTHSFDYYSGGLFINSGTVFLYKGNISNNTSLKSDGEDIYPANSGIPYTVGE